MKNIFNILIIIFISTNSCKSGNIIEIKKLFELPLQKKPFYLGGVFKNTGEFEYPENFAIDSSYIYIEDAVNKRICIIDWTGKFIGYKNYCNSIWIEPSVNIFISTNKENYYKQLGFKNLFVGKSIPENNFTAISDNVPLWSYDQKRNILYYLDQGNKIIICDSVGMKQDSVDINPVLPIKIINQDTIGAYQHKISKQKTSYSPADDIEYFEGRCDNGYYCFSSSYNTQKLFFYAKNGKLEKVIDIGDYLKRSKFDITENIGGDPGIYYILFANKIVIKITGKKSILFLQVTVI